MIMDKIKPVEWGSTNYELIHCKINIIAENTENVPIFNLSPYRGMLYNIIENINPKLTYALHKSRSEKPWTFSLFKFKQYKKTERKGFYCIMEGTSGYWILNVTSLNIFKALIQADKQGHLLYFNKLKLRITSIEYGNDTYKAMPDDFQTITIQLHTPTFFYRARINEKQDLTMKTFLEFQLRKFRFLGIIKDFSVDELLPYIRILRDDTTERFVTVSHQNKSEKNCSIIVGHSGNITFKIVGDLEMKERLWEIIRLSEFTGIGSRTSMGFGHNSIISIK